METKPQSYKDLHVWKKGIELAKIVYKVSANFPAEEKIGLIAQLRRAVVSIPSNLAEGQARRTTGEFVQFISNAEGSLAEADTQLILSVELGLCRLGDVTHAHQIIADLQKMLNALRRKLVSRD